MQRTFTPEILVKHLYHETGNVEASAIRRILKEDASLQQEFTQMQESKQALDDLDGDMPSASVIEHILAHSRQQESIATH